MNYTAYIFDLDDTLYREHDYVRSGFGAVANHVAEKYPQIDKNHFYNALIDEWQANGRGKVFDHVCGDFGLTINIQQLVKVYREHQPQIQLYDDARRCLDYLKDNQVPMAMITDGHALMQWNKIEALNVRQWISNIVVTGDLGNEYWKPSPEPYRMAVETLQLSFQECVYIGDNPQKDFITARKLGMGTVRIVRPVGDHMHTQLDAEYEADYTIHSLLNILER